VQPQEIKRALRGAAICGDAAIYLRNVYHIEDMGWFSFNEHMAYQILDSLAEEILDDVSKARREA
jgi:hypothetical protein